MNAPVWAWAVLVGVIVVLLVVDLRMAGRHRGIRGAVLTSAAWVGAGLGFGAVLTAVAGWGAGGQYFAGYLLEKSLSVDNVFVFAMIFASLGVPAGQQRRVLFYGVAGALVLRAGFIVGGAALIERFGWVLNVFAVFLLAAAWRMARGEPHSGAGSGRAVRALSRVLPVSTAHGGQRFLVRERGRLSATPLLLALVAVEVADIAFAADSIPAIFGVTRNVFLVFASNAFAILGLRALYLVFAGAMGRFVYLRHGLAVLLAFVGAKILIDPWVHVSPAVTLAVIVFVVGLAIVASVIGNRARLTDDDGPELVLERPP